MTTVQQTLQDILVNIKAAVTVSGATIATGFSTAYDWIPLNIGWVASLAGFFLSCTIIYTLIKKDRREEASRLEQAELHEAKMSAITKHGVTVNYPEK